MKAKGSIYLITNKVNNKKYVGQTCKTINARFSEHIRKAKITNIEYPIQSAIRKYGKSNFSIKLIEKCFLDELDKREIYYIDLYNTYENGYNATRGGGGHRTHEYELLAEKYIKSGLSMREYALKNQISRHTISRALRSTENYEAMSMYTKSKVKQIDKKTGKVISMYNSIKDAYLALGKDPSKSSIISAACKGKRKSAYGYRWEYV